MWQIVQAIRARVSDLIGKPNPAITMLCLLGDHRDRLLIADLCYRNQWDVFFAQRSEEASQALDQLSPQVILLDREVAGDDWRALMTSFAASSRGTCILLISRVLDDYLWNDVVCNGGYDILAKPLGEAEVARAVRLAWSYWISANQRAAMVKK